MERVTGVEVSLDLLVGPAVLFQAPLSRGVVQIDGERILENDVRADHPIDQGGNGVEFALRGPGHQFGFDALPSPGGLEEGETLGQGRFFHLLGDGEGMDGPHDGVPVREGEILLRVFRLNPGFDLRVFDLGAPLLAKLVEEVGDDLVVKAGHALAADLQAFALEGARVGRVRQDLLGQVLSDNLAQLFTGT